MFFKIKKIHFIGVGGIGMSGIAEILINKGFIVSGSDMYASDNTEHLLKLGAKIFIGHNAVNINNVELVVYSSAVNLDTNPEIVEAKKQNIPIIRRAEMLAELSRLTYTIAIAGTHGKTTTTSILSLILIRAGIDPTAIVGGRLKDLGGTNARLGQGEWTIVEADEYDRSFLQLTPTIALINNIETEHLDIYSDFDDLLETFIKFANMTPFYGFIAAGIDCAGVRKAIPDLRKKIITFGLNDNADYFSKNIHYSGFSSRCEVYEYGNLLGTLTLNVPGEHNIKNALGAILIARQFDIGFELIESVISEFHGAFRRFDIKGEKNGITIIDDYAHHPTEIVATLKGTKNYINRRIIAVFQPHTFSRTRDFYKDFATAFNDADIVYMTDIYPAREEPIEGITSQIIIDEANKNGSNNIFLIPDKEELYNVLMNELKSNDILLTLGAGDIWKLGERVLNSL
jgi:UDP-N-acetylmuramate--alanine ligase